MAYGEKMNGVEELSSLQFPKCAQWHVSETLSEKQGACTGYLHEL